MQWLGWDWAGKKLILVIIFSPRLAYAVICKYTVVRALLAGLKT